MTGQSSCLATRRPLQNAMYAGRVVKRVPRTAALHVDQPVAACSHLKLYFLRPFGVVVPGELCTKVVEPLPKEASRGVVRFTVIPEAARLFLDTVGGKKGGIS